jgi:hypothetical protein
LQTDDPREVLAFMVNYAKPCAWAVESILLYLLGGSRSGAFWSKRGRWDTENRHILPFIILKILLQAYLNGRRVSKAGPQLVQATVTQVEPVGIGDCVCVDLCNLLNPGEGLLVGWLFFVSSNDLKFIFFNQAWIPSTRTVTWVIWSPWDCGAVFKRLRTDC